MKTQNSWPKYCKILCLTVKYVVLWITKLQYVFLKHKSFLSYFYTLIQLNRPLTKYFLYFQRFNKRPLTIIAILATLTMALPLQKMDPHMGSYNGHLWTIIFFTITVVANWIALPPTRLQCGLCWRLHLGRPYLQTFYVLLNLDSLSLYYRSVVKILQRH